jgi:hypothetical protein
MIANMPTIPHIEKAFHRDGDRSRRVNAGEILQRLAGVKMQHGHKRFIPEGQRPTAVLTGLGVTGAWSGQT